MIPFLVLCRDGVAADKETAHKHAAKNGEEVSDVHGHDSQHADL